jgi:hypothetical protein
MAENPDEKRPSLGAPGQSGTSQYPEEYGRRSEKDFGTHGGRGTSAVEEAAEQLGEPVGQRGFPGISEKTRQAAKTADNPVPQISTDDEDDE